jgi:hypothetical protein
MIVMLVLLLSFPNFLFCEPHKVLVPMRELNMESKARSQITLDNQADSLRKLEEGRVADTDKTPAASPLLKCSSKKTFPQCLVPGVVVGCFALSVLAGAARYYVIMQHPERFNGTMAAYSILP